MEIPLFSLDLLFLCLASFAAGFVDSIVGGGGLIQLPAFMSILPGYPVITLLATNKLVSVSGTAFSAWRFSKQINFSIRIVVPSVLAAFLFSFFGAYVVSLVSNEVLKPVFIVMMFLVFIFTIRSKDFGMINHNHRF